MQTIRLHHLRETLKTLDTTIDVWKNSNNLHVQCISDCIRFDYFANPTQPLSLLVRVEIVADP